MDLTHMQGVITISQNQSKSLISIMTGGGRQVSELEQSWRELSAAVPQLNLVKILMCYKKHQARHI